MTQKLATLEFSRGNLQFSAGHFTIFSATERERLHGHNYSLEAIMTAVLGEPGITFDYAIFRNKLASLCESLHLRFLLPARSPYLIFSQDDVDSDSYHVVFNKKTLTFLKEDALLLPLTNITLEELSQWFIDQLLIDNDFIETHRIQAITIKCFNGTDNCAIANWQKG